MDGWATRPTSQQTTTAPKKIRYDSTNPVWVACTAKQNELYVKHLSGNKAINAEKQAALAELDRRYAAGELAYNEETGIVLQSQSEIDEAYCLAKDMITQIYFEQLMQENTSYKAVVDALHCNNL